MQNMNRLYPTFDLGSRHLISFSLFLRVLLLYSLVKISGDGAMARGQQSEKREERERRKRDSPPLPPSPPHTAMVMVRDVYITLQLGRYIYCPPSHLSIIDFPPQPCLDPPSQVKLQSTEKVGITQKKDSKRSGNLTDPAPPYLTTNKKDR